MLQGMYYGDIAKVIAAIQTAFTAANYQGLLATYANGIIASLQAYQTLNPNASIAVFFSGGSQSGNIAANLNFNVQNITITQ